MEQHPLSALLLGAQLPKPETAELPAFLKARPTKATDLLFAGTSPAPAPTPEEPPKPALLGLLDAGTIQSTAPSSDLTPELRDEMSQWMATWEANQGGIPAGTFPGAQAPGLPAHLPAFVPALISLVGALRRELEDQPTRLLQLNPSRRESLVAHLENLASVPSPTRDPQQALRSWLDPSRTPTQRAALLAYFDEVALMVLGQAIILKAWSDRGHRRWTLEDLGRLNWALSSTLSPKVPIDREGWQLTRPNLYSWYTPSPPLQREIWETLESWRITDEGPSLLATLLRVGRQNLPEIPTLPETSSYDARFFSLVWEMLPKLGLDLTEDLRQTHGFRRKRVVFSPTLRDGTMVRTGPVSIQWTGLERQPFLLLSAELIQLWWGPSAPPLWTQGSGLEVHSRDQLQLQLSSVKPTLFGRIAELEACDFSLVLEERAVRLSTRTLDAHRLREQLEELPYFRKLRSTATSLGTLQACVAISKLRPGGFLLWAREEPLSSVEGHEALGFLLEKGKLLAEWNFSGVEHSLPATAALFPRYVYLFYREPGVTERHAHRPLRVIVRGQLRSHVEVPLLLQESFLALSRNPAQNQLSTRGHWQIRLQLSPTSQKDWSDRWPDALGNDTLRKVETLENASLRLAAFCTVRPTPTGDPKRGGLWTVPPQLKGLWLRCEVGTTRKLLAQPIPEAGQERSGHGWFILFQDEGWSAPLARYLESEILRDWLDQHAERRGNHWVLNDALLRYLPIPRVLLAALGAPVVGVSPLRPPEPATSVDSGMASGFALPLPGDWEKLASELAYSPRAVRERLPELERHPRGGEIRAALFVRATRILHHLETTQGRLLSLVAADGRIRWKELFEILPKGDFTSVTTHPLVRLSGTLPPHLPIARFEKTKAPMPGILLMTESGFHLHLGCEDSRILDMLQDQLSGLRHPTWSELLPFLRLPRRMDQVEQAAAEVLRSHAEQAGRLLALRDFLNDCQLH